MNTSYVQAHEVPHILIGTSPTADLKVWMCFPKLYFRGCSTYVWEKWLEAVYGCMKRALRRYCHDFRTNASKALWKDSYGETEKAPSVQWDKAISGTVTVKKALLSDFSTSLLRSITQHEQFEDAVFVVHYTPEKRPATCSSSRAVKDAYDASTVIVRDPTQLPGWTVQLNMEFSHPGHTLLWRQKSWVEVVAQLAPDILRTNIEERLSHTMPSWTTGPTEWSPSKGSVSLGKLENGGYSRMEFGFQDSEDISIGGGWRVYTAKDTLPENIGKTVQEVIEARTLLHERAENIDVKGGYTTLAIRMPLQQARKRIRLRNQATLFSVVPNLTWW